MIRYSLVFLAGAISVLAFAPFKLWWVSIVSLSLLLALLHANNHQRGFLIGFIYGLGMFGFGTSWIFHSVHDYGQAPVYAAVAAVIVLTMVFSIFPGLAIWLYSKFVYSISQPAIRLGSFVAVWVLLEWLRSWILTGFPWLLFGHTLIDSPFAGIIPIFGTFGASAVIALFAIIILELVCTTTSQLMTKLTIVVLVAFGLYVTQFIHWSSPVNDTPVRVSLVQANIPFDMKWDPDQRGDVYRAYINHTLQNAQSELIVWPETAIPTFYQYVNKDFLRDLAQVLNERNTELLSGVFTREIQQDQERMHNSLVTIGGETQFYHKQHLVPFGEYWPLRWLFSFLRNFVIIPMSDLYPGEGSPVLKMRGIPIGVSICYEAAFGEEILRSLPDAQLLANVSNDAWFGDSLAPHQHLQIVRSRALETGRYMLRATNTGISAIIDARGAVLVKSGQFIDEVVTGEVQPMRGNTPFIVWGNWAIISIMSLLILLAFRYSHNVIKIAQ